MSQQQQQMHWDGWDRITISLFSFFLSSLFSCLSFAHRCWGDELVVTKFASFSAVFSYWTRCWFLLVVLWVKKTPKRTLHWHIQQVENLEPTDRKRTGRPKSLKTFDSQPFEPFFPPSSYKKNCIISRGGAARQSDNCSRSIVLDVNMQSRLISSAVYFVFNFQTRFDAYPHSILIWHGAAVLRSLREELRADQLMLIVYNKRIGRL